MKKYKFYKAMFILATALVIGNIILILMDRSNYSHYIRAIAMLICSASFYTLMFFDRKMKK